MKFTVILAVCCLFALMPTGGWAKLVEADHEIPDEVIDVAAVAAEPTNPDGVRNPRTKNVIVVPVNCPSGYKPDANGNCRKIF